MYEYNLEAVVEGRHRSGDPLSGAAAEAAVSLAKAGKDIRFVDNGETFIIPRHEIAYVVSRSEMAPGSDVVDDFCGGGDSPAPGDRTLVYEGQVTTESWGGGYAAAEISAECCLAPVMYATFNGTEYTLPLGEYGYGEYDAGSFGNYPLFVTVAGNNAYVFTADAGTYSIKLEQVCNGVTIYRGDITISGDSQQGYKGTASGVDFPCSPGYAPQTIRVSSDEGLFTLSNPAISYGGFVVYGDQNFAVAFYSNDDVPYMDIVCEAGGDYSILVECDEGDCVPLESPDPTPIE